MNPTDIREGADRAFYHPRLDFIQLPPFSAFVSAEAHATTLGHECIHWTMHSKRLDRDLGGAKWGDEGYAREELVAELGSVFLAADLGLAIEPREDHAAYIAHWLKVVKNDKRAIVSMAAHAERAVAFLHAQQPDVPAACDDEPLRTPPDRTGGVRSAPSLFLSTINYFRSYDHIDTPGISSHPNPRKNLASRFGVDDELGTMPGCVYADECYIAILGSGSRCRYYLVIGNREWVSRDLERQEERLYALWYLLEQQQAAVGYAS